MAPDRACCSFQYRTRAAGAIASTRRPPSVRRTGRGACRSRSNSSLTTPRWTPPHGICGIWPSAPGGCQAVADERGPEPEPSPIRAPELSGAVAWLNVPAPLSLESLRGKVVLLDFWTYGCINCIHIIPDLQKLEARFPHELVVIGVHAAKFTNEKATENIRRIIERYGIQYPVANDAEFRIWRAYTVQAWPSRVIIDPAGYIVGAASGEGNYDGFEQAIAAVIKVFDERGEINRAPLEITLEHAGAASTELMFPGKVLAASDRLYVSDSNHHQIAILSLEGAVIERIGAGTPGRADGDFRAAQFHTPQGLALVGD